MITYIFHTSCHRPVILTKILYMYTVLLFWTHTVLKLYSFSLILITRHLVLHFVYVLIPIIIFLQLPNFYRYYNNQLIFFVYCLRTNTFMFTIICNQKSHILNFMFIKLISPTLCSTLYEQWLSKKKKWPIILRSLSTTKI